MESTVHKRRMKNWKFRPPGVKRLQDFAETFKRDFDCLQPPPRRRQEIIIDFSPLNQGSSQIYESTESINVETSLTTITTINNSIAVDSPQPQNVQVQESSASVSSTSHVTLVASGDAVDSCKAVTVEGVTVLAVPYPTPPQTEDGVPEASETEEDSKSEDIAGNDDVSETEDDSKSEETGNVEVAGNDDVSETEEDSKSEETDEEIDDVEDIESDERPQLNRTYEIHHCQTVIMNDFNARGIKIKGSGNNAPQITYNDSLPSSNSSESSCYADLGQPSRYQIVPPDFTRCNLPPMIPPLFFQASGSNSLFEEEQAPMSPKVTVGTNLLMRVNDDARSGQQSPNILGECSLTQSILVFCETNFVYLGSNILPSPDESEFPSLTVKTSAHPASTGLRQSSLFLPSLDAVQKRSSNNITGDILSSQLNPHPRHYSVDSSLATHLFARDSSPDLDSILEHRLQSVLDTVLIKKKIQTSGLSISTEILTPQAQNILGMVNTVVSMETPVSTPRTTSTRRSQHCSSCAELIYPHP